MIHPPNPTIHAKRRSSSRGTGSERGIALIMVLWATALLTVVAASFAFEARTGTMLAANAADRARADAAAEAGVRRAIAGLLLPVEDRWDHDEAPRILEFAGVELHILVQSAHGKIDLNAAPEALIHGALNWLVGESGGAPQIADSILDWRDADHARRPFGFEDDDYIGAGWPFGAADQSFVSVSELRQVHGVDEETFRQIAGAFTVDTRSPRIDPGTASRAVLNSIPGLTEATVDRFLEARGPVLEAPETLAAPRLPIELLVAGARYLSRGRPSVYEILVESRLGNGHTGRRGAVVKLTRNRQNPYQIASWLTDSDPRFGAFEIANGQRAER